MNFNRALYRNPLWMACFLCFMTMARLIDAQENTSYQTPPQLIMDLVDAPPTPGASLSPSGEWMLLLDRPNLPTIDEVAQKEVRLAGLRINPRTNGSSRSFHYSGIRIKSVRGTQETAITGLPANPKIENIRWSPDEH